ncbi:TPA: hypothetical protein ACGW65_000766 [Bacillus paranthracis]
MNFEFKAFRKVMEKIIVKHGRTSVEEFFKKDEVSIRIEQDSFLPFVVEKAGNMLFIGFYRKQNGDLISDPVFVFQVKNDIWYPIRLEQAMGDTMFGMFDEDGSYLYKPHTTKSVKSFATDCSKEWKIYFLDED